MEEGGKIVHCPACGTRVRRGPGESLFCWVCNCGDERYTVLPCGHLRWKENEQSGPYFRNPKSWAYVQRTGPPADCVLIEQYMAPSIWFLRHESLVVAGEEIPVEEYF